MRILFALLLLVQLIFAASFDCALTKKDRSGVSDFRDLEVAICSDPELGYLDEMISQVYFQVKQSLPDNAAKQLLKNQRNWLKEIEIKRDSKGRTRIDLVIDTFKKRYEFFQKSYPNVVKLYTPFEDLKHSPDAQVCEQIRDDLVQSIKNVGVKNYDLFQELSFRKAQLSPYNYTDDQRIKLNNYDLTFVKLATIKGTASGKSLLYIQATSGRMLKRSETWLIDSKDFSQFFLAKTDDKDKFTVSLKKGKLISDRYVRAYYQPKIGDIYIDIVCDKAAESYSWEDAYCEHIAYVDILQSNDVSDITKICRIKDLGQDTVLEQLRKEYDHVNSDNEKISIARKMLTQPNQKGKKEFAEKILSDKNPKVRKTLFEGSSRWDVWGMTRIEQLVLVLKTTILDPIEEIRSRAYSDVDTMFFNNGSDGCHQLDMIKASVNTSTSITNSEKKEVLNYLDTTIQDRCNGNW